MTCEKLTTCPFYNDKMPIESAMGKMYKTRYCENDNKKCARYKVSSEIGKEFVPDELYPNMIEKAEKIIEAHKNRK